MFQRVQTGGNLDLEVSSEKIDTQRIWPNRRASSLRDLSLRTLSSENAVHAGFRAVEWNRRFEKGRPIRQDSSLLCEFSVNRTRFYLDVAIEGSARRRLDEIDCWRKIVGWLKVLKSWDS